MMNDDAFTLELLNKIKYLIKCIKVRGGICDLGTNMAIDANNINMGQ